MLAVTSDRMEGRRSHGTPPYPRWQAPVQQPHRTSKSLTAYRWWKPLPVCATATTKARRSEVCHIQKVSQEECNKGDKVCIPLHTAMPNYLRLSAKELPAFLDWPPLDHGHAHIQAKDEESQSSSTYLKRGRRHRLEQIWPHIHYTINTHNITYTQR